MSESKELSLDVNPITDRSNPRSIINLVAVKTQEAIENIPSQVWDMSEKELKKAGDVTHTVDLIRRSFWGEYDQAQVGKRNIVTTNVYAGICSQNYWVQRIQGNPIRLAYVLTPPKSYQNRIEVLLDIATDQILEILELPNTKKDGTADPMLGNVKHRIWETLLNRARGSVVQRSESKILQANVEVQGKKTVEIDDLTPDEIDRLLEEQEKKKNAQLIEGYSEVIDVEVEPTRTTDQS